MAHARSTLLLLAAASLLHGQQYDMVLHGAHVIDPASGLDAIADVAVSGNRIAAVQPTIPAAQTKKVLDVSGLYVVPGLIDLHAHVFGYQGSLLPDDTALLTGATSVVDAGGSGWRTFDEFRRTVIAHSKTRVLALVNIVGAGMVGEPAESNTADMDPAKTAEVIARNRDVIVGIKTAHFAKPGWTAIDRAVEAGRLAKVPVMVDDRIMTGFGRTTREELLEHLRPGDIHTHMFNDRQMELVNRLTGKVQPYMLEARSRGVLFDLGHGAGSFLWPVASRAIAQGFPPDTISTDLHATSILMQQADMASCISKMMLLGMSLPDAILRSTVNPAKTIGRYPELGTLGMGRVADIAVFDLREGVFAFKDSWGAKRLGNKRLECVLTLRNGEIVYDRDGRGFSDGTVLTSVAGDQQIYDLLLKNGHLIDPANHRNGQFDIAINGNKIARVAQHLPAAHARLVIDAAAYYVTPGLIDIRTHFLNLPADHNSLPFGVTTAVDVGSASAKDVDSFKANVIDRSKVRLLAFLNADANSSPLIKKYPDILVGVTTANNIDAALKAAELSNTVLMVDDATMLKHLRSGDILSHIFGRGAPDPDALAEARKRGVLLDVGSFSFRAVRQGFLPDTISTDIDNDSVMLPRANMTTTMSKFLNLGMTLEQIVERTTINPAHAIRRTDLGTLSEGAIADIALLEVQQGKFGFLDSEHARMIADHQLRCVLTVRNGVVVWDSEGLSATDSTHAGPYSNFK
jgi:dihydroorotase